MREVVALNPAPLVELAATWDSQVAARRQFSAVDPVADTLAICARQLREQVASAGATGQLVTPEQYAALPHVGVSPQAVRRWCRTGRLPGARQTEAGWLIPRDARRAPSLRGRVQPARGARGTR